MGIGRLGRARRRRLAEGPERLTELIDSLPEDLRQRAVTHSSWVDHRADSYGRLAFLGDAVLGLALAEYLYRRFERADIGRLTKVHGQAVSGRACVEVAEPEREPEAAARTRRLQCERTSIVEAVGVGLVLPRLPSVGVGPIEVELATSEIARDVVADDIIAGGVPVRDEAGPVRGP